MVYRPSRRRRQRIVGAYRILRRCTLVISQVGQCHALRDDRRALVKQDNEEATNLRVLNIWQRVVGAYRILGRYTPLISQVEQLRRRRTYTFAGIAQNVAEFAPFGITGGWEYATTLNRRHHWPGRRRQGRWNGPIAPTTPAGGAYLQTSGEPGCTVNELGSVWHVYRALQSDDMGVGGVC